MEDVNVNRVFDLLDELEDCIESATSLPLSNKIILDPSDINSIIRDIRLTLPEDVKVAKWIRDERDRILSDAKNEYTRIIQEANNQAAYMVQNNEINKVAMKQAKAMIDDANKISIETKMRTYDYVDRIIYKLQNQIEDLNVSYMGKMYSQITETFDAVNQILQSNRDEIKDLAYKAQTEDDKLPALIGK